MIVRRSARRLSLPGPVATHRSADLRLGGTWSPAQRIKNGVLCSLVWVALWFARPLPRHALLRIGFALGRLAFVTLRRARRTALANVARVYPAMTTAERLRFVRHCFDTLGTLLGDAVALLRLRSDSPNLPVSPHARCLFEEARRAQCAVIFVSAHLGPWERVAASLVAAGIPLLTIARESYDPRLTRLYERLRMLHGVGVVWRDRPGAAARIVRALRHGGVLGVPMDLRSRVASCDVDFMGCPAPTPVGPARLALRARARVVVGSVAPAVDGGVEVTATRIETKDLCAGDDGAHVLTERINSELSRRILALPHAWVWMHERWTNDTVYDGSAMDGASS